MSTHTHDAPTSDRSVRGLATETRPATRTTELIAYVAAVVAVALTALLVGDDGANTADPVSAEQALRYITYLTIGYMLARGLAKSGSRSHRDHHDA